MNTQCTFDFMKDKDVEVRFDGGTISTDAGLSVFVEALDQTDEISSYASILDAQDTRRDDRIVHTNDQLLRQRILQVVAGYEDANDSDELRDRPLFKAANGRLTDEESNASQPTMSRLENRVTGREVVKLNDQLLEQYINHHEGAPETITLEMDSTGASTHGDQQLSMFHAYRGQTQYHPLIIADAQTGELLSVRLRAGSVSDKHRAYPQMKRVLNRLTEAFGETTFRFRADSGFTDVRLYRLLDEYDVDWAINYAPNEVLNRRTEPILEAVVEQYEQTKKPAVQYVVLEGYQAKTWNKSRYVVAKVECTSDGTNRRYVVNSSKPKEAKQDYEFYAQRGVCEQYIKEFKDGYRGDKLSCSEFMANAFRLVLVGIAYSLVARFRADHLEDTELEGVWIETIRRNLFKLGARIKVTARRMWIHASESWPYRELFMRVARSVFPAVG